MRLVEGKGEDWGGRERYERGLERGGAQNPNHHPGGSIGVEAHAKTDNVS